MKKKYSLFVGVAAIAAFTTSVAHAQTTSLFGDPAPTARVSYADLDLATPAGRDMLNSRIAAAVDQVCARPNNIELYGRTLRERCRGTALRSTEVQVARAMGREGDRAVAGTSVARGNELAGTH